MVLPESRVPRAGRGGGGGRSWWSCTRHRNCHHHGPSPVRPCASSTMQNPRLPLVVGTCRTDRSGGISAPRSLPNEYVTLRQKLRHVSSTAGQSGHTIRVRAGLARKRPVAASGSACPRGTGPPPWWCAGTGSTASTSKACWARGSSTDATGASDAGATRPRSAGPPPPGQGVVDPVDHEAWAGPTAVTRWSGEACANRSGLSDWRAFMTRCSSRSSRSRARRPRTVGVPVMSYTP